MKRLDLPAIAQVDIPDLIVIKVAQTLLVIYFILVAMSDLFPVPTYLSLKRNDVLMRVAKDTGKDEGIP